MPIGFQFILSVDGKDLVIFRSAANVTFRGYLLDPLLGSLLCDWHLRILLFLRAAMPCCFPSSPVLQRRPDFPAPVCCYQLLSFHDTESASRGVCFLESSVLLKSFDGNNHFILHEVRTNDSIRRSSYTIYIRSFPPKHVSINNPKMMGVSRAYHSFASCGSARPATFARYVAVGRVSP
jgi:hypothetical protein